MVQREEEVLNFVENDLTSIRGISANLGLTHDTVFNILNGTFNLNLNYIIIFFWYSGKFLIERTPNNIEWTRLLHFS